MTKIEVIRRLTEHSSEESFPICTMGITLPIFIGLLQILNGIRKVKYIT